MGSAVTRWRHWTAERLMDLSGSRGWSDRQAGMPILTGSRYNTPSVVIRLVAVTRSPKSREDADGSLHRWSYQMYKLLLIQMIYWIVVNRRPLCIVTYQWNVCFPGPDPGQWRPVSIHHTTVVSAVINHTTRPVDFTHSIVAASGLSHREYSSIECCDPIRNATDSKLHVIKGVA